MNIATNNLFYFNNYFFISVAGLSYGQAQNFALVNGTDFIISYVYISQSSPDDRDEDILTVYVLGANEECEIVFEGQDDENNSKIIR